MISRWGIVALAVVLAMPAAAGDAPAKKAKPQNGAGAVILAPSGSGGSIGSIGGQPLIVQPTPTGSAGRLGGDPFLVHRDGNITVGKVGNKSLLCHSDPASGITVCK